MANRLQLRKGNTAQNTAFTGAIGELTYDTDKKQVRVHDGDTVGGVTLASQQDIEENLLNYLPTPYPKSTPPNGYLALMGQTISQATYPKLYSLYGAVLPDLRAHTIRGLDNGRGIDVDRAVLSEQGDAIQNIIGRFSGFSWSGGASGAVRLVSNTQGDVVAAGNFVRNYEFDASRVVPTADENRVKNIAFLYIVKAG